jgi:group I intron endonuclease
VFIIGTAGIYVIINKANWKVYIGQSGCCKDRWRKHKGNLLRNAHVNKHLQAAFNKYGEDSFVYKVLEECSEETRDERECYWINHYNSCNKKHGYNKVTGGHKGKRLTEETKLKIGKAHKGRKLTKEHRRKLSEWQRGRTLPEEHKRKIGNAHRGEKNYFYGKKFSNEHKEKLSKAKKDRPRTEMELEVLKEMIKNNTVSITDEMVKDVENGMSRRKFGKKYGTQNVWRRIKGSYSLSEELVG